MGWTNFKFITWICLAPCQKQAWNKLCCALRQSFAPNINLLRLAPNFYASKKLLKSWALGMNCLAQGANKFMKLTPVRAYFWRNCSKLWMSTKKYFLTFLKGVCMSPPCQFYNTGFIHFKPHYVITMLKSFNIKKY